MDAGRPFLPEEYFLEPWTILGIGIRSLLSPPRAEVHRIRQVTFSSCVYQQDLKDWTGLAGFYSLAVGALARGLKDRGICPGILVLIHENNSWEKSFIHGLRKWLPATTITGYVHPTASKNFLMYHFTKTSPDLRYLPDILLTNGIQTARFLRSGNYPPERIRVGGALRYSGLLERARSSGPGAALRPGDILVTLPIDLDESVELLDKTCEALADAPGITVWCRPHPFLSLEALNRSLSPGMLDRVRFTRDSLDQVLPKVGAVVYSTSISCMDALSMGVPVLKILLERRLDIDPLAEYRGKTPFIRTARAPAEIAEEIRALLHRSFTTDERMLLSDLTGEIFSPVTDETYASFTMRKDAPGEGPRTPQG